MELHTKRLSLKPVTENDAHKLSEIITNESVRKYLFDNEILDKEQIDGFLITSIKNFHLKNYGLWLIKNDELNTFIGFVGLWHFFEEPQPQLLYALLPEFAGQGFATEASNEIIRYSFKNLGFDHLTASCDTTNRASHKVAERIGMKKSREELINEKPLTFYRIENKNLLVGG